MLLADVLQVTWVTPTCGGAGACHKVSGVMTPGEGDGQGGEPREFESYYVQGREG